MKKINLDFFKDKNPLELLADLFVAFLFVMIVSVFSLQAICGGWDEGSGAGTCAISALDGYYNFIMMTGTIMSFTGFMWIWLIPIAFVIKIRKLIKEGPISFVKKYPLDALIYLPVFGLFIFLIYILFF